MRLFNKQHFSTLVPNFVNPSTNGGQNMCFFIQAFLNFDYFSFLYSLSPGGLVRRNRLKWLNRIFVVGSVSGAGLPDFVVGYFGQAFIMPERDESCGAFPVLGYRQPAHALTADYPVSASVELFGAVHCGPVDEEHHIGVLLDGARFP